MPSGAFNSPGLATPNPEEPIFLIKRAEPPPCMYKGQAGLDKPKEVLI